MELSDTIKLNIIHITGIPVGDENEKEQKMYLEKKK